MSAASDEVIRRAAMPSPDCPACRSPFLAWQPALRCVLWRCPRCGFIERDLALSPAHSRAQEYGGDPAGDRVRLALTEHRLRHRLGARLHGRVLEIGGGDCSLAARLAADGTEVVVVEPQGTRLTPAAITSGVAVLPGRLEDVALPDGSFDVIVAIHVLEHVEDVVATLALARDLLAPGGVLYAVTPSADCASLRVFGEHWWMLEDPTHLRFISVAAAGFLASLAGFAAWRARRLVTDSLAVEAATAARALGLGHPQRGVLSRPAVQVAATAALPLTLSLRAVRPRWRPALEIEFLAAS